MTNYLRWWLHLARWYWRYQRAWIFYWLMWIVTVGIIALRGC